MPASPRPLTPQDVLDFRLVEDEQISPDGKQTRQHLLDMSRRVLAWMGRFLHDGPK